MFCILILLCISLLHANCSNYSRSLPEGFLLGVGTSSIQIEGAWNISKGESIWDVYVKNKDYISETKHGERPDEACDSYHKYQRDIEMLKELNAKSYRFSISMSRILPNGQPNAVNQEAIDYYNNVIDLLVENNISPIVTMYHFELPQALQQLGGFANPLVQLWLTTYARILYQNFGDRVKYWITINEPMVNCFFAYNMFGPIFPPGINASGTAELICLKNTLKAHASMYHLYKREFKESQKGKVTIAPLIHWSEAASDSWNDIEATQRFKELSINLFNDPIFSKQGGWPAYVVDYVARKSEESGFPYSVLPELTPDEVEFIKGTYDFLGLNYYFTHSIFGNTESDLSNLPTSLANNLNSVKRVTGTTVVRPVRSPEGIRKILNYFKDRYGVTDVLITENGYSTGSDASLDDDSRIISIRSTLDEILKIVYEDRINVFGYEYWSLMDHFDFTLGYKGAKYGLYHTDFDSKEKTRTPRKSAKVFQQIATDGAIDWNYKPKSPYDMKEIKKKKKWQ